MGDVAASRRARSRFGDFAFSVIAAGLGLALLFATGRHLFGAPSVDQPQQSLAPLAATAVGVPAPKQVASAGARAKESFALPASHLFPARPNVARAANPSRGVRRPRSTVRVGNAVSSKAASKPVARTSRAAKPLRRREAFPARVARLVTSRPHPAPAANGARGPSFAATPHRIAGRVAVSGRPRIERRALPARSRSIIEPPLGYDAQPALVLAPGAAQIELGERALPTIRSRRRRQVEGDERPIAQPPERDDRLNARPLGRYDHLPVRPLERDDSLNARPK